jgi:glycosyltransferase involved in cell wall biosynthesis
VKGISAALISWNEASTIDLCFKSLKGFVEEIILVDTGSFDGTIEKVRELFDEFDLSGEIIEKKAHSLGEGRFSAVEKCSNDWILLSDSNMVYGDEVKNEFLKVQRDGKMGAMASLNLMGDYEHCFSPLPMNALHLTLFLRDKIKWSDLEDRPHLKGRRKKPIRRMKSWAVNLSRVRPAWRYWYRGEPFNPQFITTHRWKTESNRQYHWGKMGEYLSLIHYVEEVEGISFNRVKEIAPQWMLEMLRCYAQRLSEDIDKLLPSVIKEEQKNPRYRIVYDEKGKISDRRPRL